MKRKRLIALSIFVLLTTTGTGVAFGAMLDATVSLSNEQIATQVTKEVIVSGPVKLAELQMGPVLSSDAPLVGSADWMAQEKAERDKLKSDAEKAQDELKAEIARLEKIASDTKRLNETLFLVKKQIGKTPWVFSGSTPNGWDCSGLVRWTYSHLGIDLLHSASAQRVSGEFVKKPKIGDLVSFNHKSYGSAYHIGIYVGPDEMIHAGGKPGDKTEIVSIKGWAKGNGGSEITYTRIIETNN
jgi:cell wall-associated NlpC family hydrolase